MRSYLRYLASIIALTILLPLLSVLLYQKIDNNMSFSRVRFTHADPGKAPVFAASMVDARKLCDTQVNCFENSCHRWEHAPLHTENANSMGSTTPPATGGSNVVEFLNSCLTPVTPNDNKNIQICIQMVMDHLVGRHDISPNDADCSVKIPIAFASDKIRNAANGLHMCTSFDDNSAVSEYLKKYGGTSSGCLEAVNHADANATASVKQSKCNFAADTNFLSKCSNKVSTADCIATHVFHINLADKPNVSASNFAQDACTSATTSAFDSSGASNYDKAMGNGVELSDAFDNNVVRIGTQNNSVLATLIAAVVIMALYSVGGIYYIYREIYPGDNAISITTLHTAVFAAIAFSFWYIVSWPLNRAPNDNYGLMVSSSSNDDHVQIHDNYTLVSVLAYYLEIILFICLSPFLLSWLMSFYSPSTEESQAKQNSKESTELHSGNSIIGVIVTAFVLPISCFLQYQQDKTPYKTFWNGRQSGYGTLKYSTMNGGSSVTSYADVASCDTVDYIQLCKNHKAIEYRLIALVTLSAVHTVYNMAVGLKLTDANKNLFESAGATMCAKVIQFLFSWPGKRGFGMYRGMLWGLTLAMALMATFNYNDVKHYDESAYYKTYENAPLAPGCSLTYILMVYLWVCTALSTVELFDVNKNMSLFNVRLVLVPRKGNDLDNTSNDSNKLVMSGTVPSEMPLNLITDPAQMSNEVRMKVKSLP